MRSYGQYCALAKALDVVGDRWTLLIVRELLTRGACRYTDLRTGLPGIATNLLADRLRELEDAGLVLREDAPPPVATALFKLTERGEALSPVLQELGRWGAPLLKKRVRSDQFRTHWMSLPLRWHLKDLTPDAPPLTIEVRTGNEPLTIATSGGAVHTRPGCATNPDLVLTGTPELVVGLLLGWFDVETASLQGLKISGDPALLRRLRRAGADSVGSRKSTGVGGVGA
jgi:DNA-binding HxlR family transcriptional regulator